MIVLCYYLEDESMGQAPKKCRWFLETGKGKETDCRLKPPEGMQPYWYLDLVLVNSEWHLFNHLKHLTKIPVSFEFPSKTQINCIQMCVNCSAEI